METESPKSFMDKPMEAFDEESVSLTEDELYVVLTRALAEDIVPPVPHSYHKRVSTCVY